MAETPYPTLSKEEYARRGDNLFERLIRPHVASERASAFVVIDIDSGDYEVDHDELAASDRLRARRPTAQIWLRRVGSPYARTFGPRHISTHE